jgi:hypothetical protein
MRRHEYVNHGGKIDFLIMIMEVYLIMNKVICGIEACDKGSQNISLINVHVFFNSRLSSHVTLNMYDKRIAVFGS